jgi:uncharacterized protein
LSEATPGPVAPASRIVEVDMVRGFALFGVLLVNMYNFGADSIAWNSPADQVAFAIKRVFFESKSWTLFSMLFGFGFAVQLQRAEVRGLRILPAYLRRLAVLFAIGAAHALLFDGDILMLYAELGLGLLVLRHFPTRGLFFLIIGLMLVFPLSRLDLAGDRSAGMNEIESVAEARAELAWAKRHDVYATGSLAEVAADNASAIPALPLEDIDTPESGLAVLAMFLIGFAVGRFGILGDISGHAAAIARVRFWGLVFGFGAMVAERVLAITAGYAVFEPSQSGPAIQFTGDILFAFGITALALGYAATIVLAAQTPRGRAALTPLAGVDRLALTVYLTQTLMFTTLFYGYGFGQAFRLGPAAVTAWAVVIFCVQLVVCQWWLKRFRFGPVEWMWRSLTYLKWQPLHVRSR